MGTRSGDLDPIVPTSDRNELNPERPMFSMKSGFGTPVIPICDIQRERKAETTVQELMTSLLPDQKCMVLV